MASNEVRGEGVIRKGELPIGNKAGRSVELRLPATPEYLPVLRATAGVVAGNLSFNYDEILQIRVAVSEAFGLALDHARGPGESPEISSLTVTFVVEPEALEILIAYPAAALKPAAGGDESESRAVIESLVDAVEYGVEPAGTRVIRMVKLKSDGGR